VNLRVLKVFCFGFTIQDIDVNLRVVKVFLVWFLCMIFRYKSLSMKGMRFILQFSSICGCEFEGIILFLRP
jgi:hypothetical protein